jgi:hypothetical protein
MHSFRMRRLLKGLGRILLYCVLAVVVLSIGLRVHSAWQIPKAKRLLAGISQIRPGSPVDERVRSLLTNYNFRRDRDCSDESCYFDVQIAGADIGASIDLEDKALLCFFQHVLLNLGFRPWAVLANIRTSNGQVTGTGFVMLIADQSPIGVGGSIFTSTLQAGARSTNADFILDESHKYGSRMLRVHFAPSAPRALIDSSFAPDFSRV